MLNCTHIDDNYVYTMLVYNILSPLVRAINTYSLSSEATFFSSLDSSVTHTYMGGMNYLKLSQQNINAQKTAFTIPREKHSCLERVLMQVGC